MLHTFKSKQDINTFLAAQDMSKGIVKVCTKVVKIVEQEDSAMYDRICEIIETSQQSCSRYNNAFVAIMWGKGYTQVSYDASRVPKAYAFVCILKQILKA